MKVTRKHASRVTFSSAKSEIAGVISEIAIPNDVSFRDCISVFVPCCPPFSPLAAQPSSYYRLHGAECVGGPN